MSETLFCCICHGGINQCRHDGFHKYCTEHRPVVPTDLTRDIRFTGRELYAILIASRTFVEVHESKEATMSPKDRQEKMAFISALRTVKQKLEPHFPQLEPG